MGSNGKYWWMRREVSSKDWEEHFEHENGKYENRCIYCRELFYGHKRAMVCRLCRCKDGLADKSGATQ